MTRASTPVDWPKDSQKHELLFKIQNSKAKYFGSRFYYILFPHVQHQQTNKMYENHQQENIGMQRENQLAITDSDNRVQVIQYQNVVLQGEIRNAR